MLVRILPALFAAIFLGCSSQAMDLDAGADALPVDRYRIKWSCEDTGVVVSFAGANILEWLPEDIGGFFWLYRDTDFLGGGQLAMGAAMCWDLRFAGQPVSAAAACPTGAGFAGYAIYRDTIAQTESRCNFVAGR